VRTHHGLYDAVLEKDEEKDADRHKDLRKDKLTFTECIIALAVSIALVTLIAIALFMGLILVPLVEKAAEHMTAVDEAWDNQ
jgi:Ca2+:H+ antiporter